jgi:hypothetical protein
MRPQHHVRVRGKYRTEVQIVEGIAELLDFVIGVLQIIAGLFLAYGAYLATRKTGELQISEAPTSSSAASPRRPGESGPKRDAGESGNQGKMSPSWTKTTLDAQG